MVNDCCCCWKNAKTQLFRIKRVAIYLILRHSFQGSGPILYSYIYELFHSNKPSLIFNSSCLHWIFQWQLFPQVFEKRLPSRFLGVFGIYFIMTLLSLPHWVLFGHSYKSLYNTKSELLRPRMKLLLSLWTGVYGQWVFSLVSLTRDFCGWTIIHA